VFLRRWGIPSIFKISSFFIQQKNDNYLGLKYFICVLFILLFISILIVFSLNKLDYQLKWDSVYRYRLKFFYGWLHTIAISFTALMMSLMIGFSVAFMRKSRNIILKMLSRVYVEIIRSTPLLVQILIFFYLIAAAFSLNNRYIVGILTLSVFSGAYVSEIIRGGLDSISESQLESAKAIGLSHYQTYRFIVIPQVIKRVLPALAGQFVSLIKDSSLLSIIAISEFTLNAQEVNSYTYSTLESYIPLAFGYFILTFPISLVSAYLEKKTNYAS